jgi:membrane-associated protease RseP (regulator of RpoE activity)
MIRWIGRNIVAPLVILSAIVVVHEWSHMFVAKAFGVGVTRASIGFGPVLCSTWIGETEYCISAIPLGGYVMPVDEESASLWSDDELADLKRDHPEVHALLFDRSRWLSSQPPGVRTSVALAGPLANFLLSFALVPYFWYAIRRGGVTQKDLKWFDGPERAFMGPIAIWRMAGRAVDQGLFSVLAYTAMLSTGIGFFNLIPVPPLDGGHVLLTVIGLFGSLSGAALLQQLSIIALLSVSVFTIFLVVETISRKVLDKLPEN